MSDYNNFSEHSFFSDSILDNPFGFGYESNLLYEDFGKEQKNEFNIFQMPKLLYLDEEKNMEFSQNDIQKSILLKSPTKLEIEEQNKYQKKVPSSTEDSSEQKLKVEIKKLKFCVKTPKIKNNDDNNESSLPSYFKFESYKKYCKAKINKYATETLNKYIKNSILSEIIKEDIHLPNYKLFTSKVTEDDNLKSLKFKVKDIFIIGKENKALQNQNFKIISKIYEYLDKYEILPDNLKKIKNFLEMSYEDLIKAFYESKEFYTFKNDKRTKFYDDETKAQEGFSLLEGYGLIKLFKLLKKKRKSH